MKTIDKINNIAKYNLIDTKYCQMVFQLARWRCSPALFGNPWSNKTEWWQPEGGNPWNLLFSSWISTGSVTYGRRTVFFSMFWKGLSNSAYKCSMTKAPKVYSEITLINRVERGSIVQKVSKTIAKLSEKVISKRG